MKKRFMACLILLALLLGSLPTTLLAADSEPVYTVEREEVEGLVYHHITMMGSLPAAAGKEAKMVAVKKGTTVYDDQTVKALDQTTVTADGTYTFQFTLTEAGEYTVTVQFNGLETPQGTSIEVKEQSFYKSIIDYFNDPNVTSEQLAGYVETYGGDLGLYTGFFEDLSGTEQIGVGTRLKAHVGSFRIDNISQLFNEAQILAFLQYKTTPADIKELVNFYENSYFKLGSQDEAKNIYTSFLGMAENVQNAVIAKWTGKSYKNFQEVRDNFNEAVLLSAFSNLTNAKVYAFLKENNDFLQLENLDTLEDLQVDSILNQMHQHSNKITSVETFCSQFEEAYEDVQSGSSSSGDNTGGVSNPIGSGISISTGNATSPVPPQMLASGQGTFTDLDSVPWAKDAIMALFNKGIINGKATGIFAPEDPITREEFAKIIVAAFDLLDENAKCDFTDLSETDWSYPYVASAKKHEMVKGYDDGSFGKSDAILRQDMAVIIYRAMVTLKLAESLDSVKTEGLFTDQALIAPYALNSVIMLNNLSLLKGNERQEFQPQHNATRAEVAVLMDRVLNEIK